MRSRALEFIVAATVLVGCHFEEGGLPWGGDAGVQQPDGQATPDTPDAAGQPDTPDSAVTPDTPDATPVCSDCADDEICFEQACHRFHVESECDECPCDRCDHGKLCAIDPDDPDTIGCVDP
ncbi:MAG TPA: hypothetical protein VL172_23240 [Kofleriaceae bacterium]|jgi:hypothetical protein|nr:hypothetical protein [Kofleriaceae bacterium]